MKLTMNIAGHVDRLPLGEAKALWPVFEAVVNSIQSLEDTEVENKSIEIYAERLEGKQITITGAEEQTHFTNFYITDNGNGFTEENYKSFLEAYSKLKVAKGCKGIGRFLWLKAFDKVEIESIYKSSDGFYKRVFSFDKENGVEPEDNVERITDTSITEAKTTVSLKGMKANYRDSVSLSLEILARKVIEHCLPYFVVNQCPQIVLTDSDGDKFDLNQMYSEKLSDRLEQDTFNIKDQNFRLYHMLVTEGADKHELHLCANNREVKPVELKKKIPDLTKKINGEEGSYYYVGYLTGDYLDSIVNTDRYEFNFLDAPLLNTINENEIVDAAIEYIRAYLSDDIQKIAAGKHKQIDNYVHYKMPQYRYLLNERPEVYDLIPAGLPDDKLGIELYKQQQAWELEIAKKKENIEAKRKELSTDDDSYISLFKEYCSSVTKLSQASLTGYVVHRKAVLDILEKALESDENDSYSKESRIHSIICPMQITSDDVQFEEMNLWIVDDRLSYHRYLASDKQIKTLPMVQGEVTRRIDISIFDTPISYAPDTEDINSVTIIELKRPMRDNLQAEGSDPIKQVLGYVNDIKSGSVKRASGRPFGNVSNAAFYCYVIADLTDTMKEDAKYAGLTETPDGEGYFGYNSSFGAYVEVISYTKLVKDAKKRNQVLFDKLFEPKATNHTVMVGE